MNAEQHVEQIEKTARPLDTALLCLVTVAKMLGIPADAVQMRRAYVVGDGGMDDITFIRAARDLGMKSQVMIGQEATFSQLPLPVVVPLKNGNYVVAARIEGERVILVDPYKSQPGSVPLANLFKAWNQRIILITKGVGIVDKARTFNLSWFIPIVLRYKRFFGEVLLISFILQLFGLVAPLFTQTIIDKVLVHRSLGTLDVLVLGMVVISIFQVWMTGVRSYLFTNTTNKIDVTLSSKLFRHITALPIKYFETWQVGDVVSRVRELDNIRQFITGSSLTLVLDIVFAIVYIAVMFMYSSSLSMVAMVVLPLYILLNVIITPIFRQRLNQKFIAGTENQAFLIETVTGMQTVKSLAVEPQFVQKWEQLLARYAKAAFATANLANIAGNIGSFLQQLFTLAILWIGAHAVMDEKLTVGELVAFQMLAGQVIAPVLRLVNMWQYFQQTSVSIERLGEILNETGEPTFNPNRTTLPYIRGEIVLDRVTFRYRSDTSEVLRQLSLHIKSGMRVGIVGRSGSGKSTLTKILQRLYVPESGRVLIDGVDLVQVEPAWLRRQIGVVLQENYLFNGTISQNIATARPEATVEEIQKVAKIAGADEFIQGLSKGYDTNVGERGAALSGGQRQRIAIARALLPDPSVLIFDEATSALDYESERIIMDNLDIIAQGRTMIMIAHRLSTVRRCDLIVVMEKGSIVEMGSHDQLLKQQGFYYDLHRQQQEM
jgi:subfamily B ATP-binding cassette protein HlyB/CyaB